MSLEPGVRLGAYEIVSLLGAGGMGEVYRARDTRLGRDVAIKVLSDAFVHDADRLARFKREAHVLASLNHPNIGSIYGLEEASIGSALVLEFVDGPTLADRIGQGPIPIEEALPIATQIAEALEAAHEHGVIHRDLKPANIKLTPDGKVKVLDFGLAKASDRSDVGRNFPGSPKPFGEGGSSAGSERQDPAHVLSESPTITSPAMTMGGVILGTAAYMSPEQARGRAVDTRSDIWAFGCVLYEMLTGRRAFEGDDVSETLAAVLRADPNWAYLPHDVPQPIRLLLRRCLDKDRTKRLSHMAIAPFLIAEIGEMGQPVAPAIDRSRHRALALGAVAAAIVVASLSAVWIFWRSEPNTQPTRFSIVPPSVQPLVLNEGDRNIAIAPDGRTVVYLVAEGQSSHLAVRTADRLDGKVLDGTADARMPFFSSDGHWVGFYADGQLKKMPVTGGSAMTLCRVGGVLRGAAWGDDDFIVFANNDPKIGLQKVSANGGDTETLTRVDAERGEYDHLFPVILPQSRTVLFTLIPSNATGGDGPATSAQIVSVDVKSGERKVLIRGGSQAVYVDAGYLVYASASALHAAPFDPSRLELTGASVPVVEQVVPTTNGGSNFDISRSGTLAYVPGTSPVADRALVWIDRQGRVEPLKAPPRGYADPRLSPDARHVAVEIIDDGDDVWTFDLARGALEKKTFDTNEDETVIWSPDGQWIAYSSSRGADRVVLRRRADGSGPEERLWSAPLVQAHAHVEDWTSDGQMVLVSIGAANGGQGDVTLLQLQPGSTPKVLLQTPFNERGARVSPNRRWVAYSSDESGREEVYVRPFPSLDGKWQVSTGGGSQPVWSRRGDELFYRADAVMSVPIRAGASFSPGAPQKLFDDQSDTKGLGHTGYDVSPDAKRFLMVAYSGSFLPNAPATITVVLNWVNELKRRMSVRD